MGFTPRPLQRLSRVRQYELKHFVLTCLVLIFEPTDFSVLRELRAFLSPRFPPLLDPRATTTQARIPSRMDHCLLVSMSLSFRDRSPLVGSSFCFSPPLAPRWRNKAPDDVTSISLRFVLPLPPLPLRPFTTKLPDRSPSPLFLLSPLPGVPGV